MSQPANILLGVSGGIAAFKAPEIVRRFRERGHNVRCAITRSAPAFVTPLTLEVLTGHAVYREEFLEANNSGEELHISVARWADVFCVAPATCNLLARLALGLADDFVSTTALAFEGAMVVAPAMSAEMWEKEAVQQHVETLRRRGVRIVGPVEGPLATGEHAMGRMVEPIDIVLAAEGARSGQDLAGQNVLVVAGPTREPLDPVRFFSTRSTGRMGFSLAEEAARRGARTLLVAGPVALPTPKGVERTDVVTALEMEQAVHRVAPEADIVVMAAAVADFRPQTVSAEKIKKREGARPVQLVANPDILSGLRQVAPNALRVGFAAETGALEEEARRKLESKGAHMIIANDVSRSDIGFESEANEVVVLQSGRPPLVIPKQSKQAVASKLLDLMAEVLKERDEELVSSDR
jgi:phosphopantothenoylcysteine decarboxylase/phosphopantothenate--cysteine ligase